ncbi:heterocyst frequency control protein PatD [Microcoleus sp. FACHB-672]|uniref:heterocyst frequency control protein PatD n=1 Tax=Microcoleus sp. FACHB-672 TaxID=2692825 RepID=UPI001688C89E|nr:heterocyst frequency control protein PatD [Microcoleus sp. FACHB-672]MBD2040917.1 heterocyst frequency control protein PatD [Microcoleus sp. FACHB-672]
MLPEIHRQHYQRLYELLERLQQIALPEGVPDKATFSKALPQVWQFFQEQILSLPADELDRQTASKVQSYQTEMHKQLKLLDTDVMLLQASRQPATIQQRQAQLGDRIKTLMGYCEAVLGSEE